MLKRLFDLSRELDLLIEKRRELYSGLTTGKSSVYSGKLSGSFEKHIFDQLVILGDKIDQKTQEYLDLYSRVFNWMYSCEELTRQERLIIFERYLFGRTLKQAAENTGLSYMHLCRLLKKIEEKEK